MRIPENIKDVQKLTGRLAALNRFNSKDLKETSSRDLRSNMHLKK
jgi:hypothetical protein